ncbi:DNA cytosine methyltransferase [Verrucosispora sp. SN26_14.1]|uniref:DNA cytosine methyltransferase n=1 Tax=Verrucosispora sp. SN26_14.1 TaxID=2527879 RepID=UPI0010336B5F|nr:DNA cytosine methyltransferase [Verrucosispora sp. SN26_14.1]TBL44267.1 DNA cytosine methyltransferase [Verrucosispora sp. SN26_14.1]
MNLDLYAGAGGWDEGARHLGLSTVGLELEHDPCVTAVRAGHPRVRCDIATYPTRPFVGRVTGLIASPPCQAWSMAGKRAGEQDKARVHQLVDDYAAGADHPGDGWADPRSHHAAQPVRWIRDLRPEWVTLEQVPPVIDLWRHIGDVLRGWGYSVWTGVLNSADYGVPQTRRRAILIASRVRPVYQPETTHEQNPPDNALFGARQPWVSMAQALGWDGVDRPARTICGDRSPRWAYGQGNSYATGWTLDRRTISRGPAGTRVPVAPVEVERPAPTVTSQTGCQWVLRNNTNDNACTRRLDEPAGTLFFGARLNNVSWVRERPATTVQGDPRIGRPGHKDREGGESQFEQDALRVTVEQAAILQSFPADYPWHGNKTSQFLQVGNAIPPGLAAPVLAVAAGITTPARIAA